MPSLKADLVRIWTRLCSQTREHFEYTLFLVLAATVILTPLVVDVSAYLTFEPIKVHIFLLGALGVGMLLCIGHLTGVFGRHYKEDLRRIRQNRILMAFCIAFVGYWATIVVASFTSIAPLVSFWGMDPRYHGLMLYGALLTFTLGVGSMRPALLKRLLEITMVTAGLVSLFGIFQRVIPELNQWWDVSSFLYRTYSTLGHPNYLADYLVLITPLFFWKFIESRRWYLWLALGGAILLAFVLTLSRSGLLGLLVSIFFFISVYSWWTKRRRLLGILIAIPVIMLAVIGYANVRYRDNFVNSQTLLSRFVIAGENLRSFETRLQLWPATITLVAKRPVLGYGPDTFTLAFARVAPKELLITENLNSYADRAHNILLDTLVEIGLVGTICWLIILALVVVWAARSRSVVMLALGSGLVGHFISQQFGFQTVPHMMLMWMLVASIFVMQWREDTSAPAPMKRIGFLKSALVIISIIAVIAGVRGVASNWKADRLARIWEYEKALSSAPHRVKYIFEWLSGTIEDAPEDPRIPAQLTQLEQFTNGQDHHVFWYRARWYQTLGQYDEAYREYERAIAIAPTVPEIYKTYGQALFDGGRYQQAIDMWQYYVDLAPPYWKEHKAYADGKLSAWERNRYEVFYKFYPSFDQIFDSLTLAREKLQSK